MELVVSLKDLMVRVAGQFQVQVDEALKEWKNHSLIMDSLVHFLKNIVETFGLLFRGTENIISEPCIPILVQVFNEQVKLFVESGLRFGVKLDFVTLNLFQGLT